MQIDGRKHRGMPVLAKFYGIVIRMLFVRDFIAHFFAYYENSELMIGLAPLRVIQGQASARVGHGVGHATPMRTVDAWNHLAQARQPQPIQPLV